jgi:hypothetical protein
MRLKPGETLDHEDGYGEHSRELVPDSVIGSWRNVRILSAWNLVRLIAPYQINENLA